MHHMCIAYLFVIYLLYVWLPEMVNKGQHITNYQHVTIAH